MANWIPGINVGNVYRQITDWGGDYDVLDNVSFDGGARDAGGANFGNPLPRQGATKSGYDATGRYIGTGGQANTGQLTTDATNTASGTTYSGGGSTPNYAQLNAAQIAQLQQSEGLLNNALGRLPNQLNIAHGNIDRQFNTRNNELNTLRDTNENQYNTSSTQNQQNLRNNKNVINDQASSGLRGLQRLLGSYGAVGSDMGLAGRAVADQASAQNSGAGQTYSQNQNMLDTNWGNFQNQFENERKKVADWRQSQRQSTEQQSTTTRQDLLSRLADIRGQIAAARGGSYAASAQPFLDQANQLSGRIDELGRLNPAYTGETPVYESAPLSSYDTGNGASIGAQDPRLGGMNTPWLNLLLGRDRERQPMVR